MSTKGRYRNSRIAGLMLCCFLVVFAATSVDAQQVLPRPELPFGGVINRNASESQEWWPPRVEPPKGAPNVLLIMTDDVGFGASSTFGGPVPTPTLDRLAHNGLRYNMFHTTALCSPRGGLIRDAPPYAHTGVIMSLPRAIPAMTRYGKDTQPSGICDRTGIIRHGSERTHVPSCSIVSRDHSIYGRPILALNSTALSAATTVEPRSYEGTKPIEPYRVIKLHPE